MITEITKYALIVAECYGDNGVKATISRLVEFDEEPNLEDIQHFILDEIGEACPEYKWKSSLLLNLQFMTKAAYDTLSRKD